VGGGGPGPGGGAGGAGGAAAGGPRPAWSPPHSDRRPELSRRVNVEGTRIVAEAVARAPRRPRLVYASSLSVYGRTQHLPAPRLVTDPVDPGAPAGRTKAPPPELVRGPGTAWVILRFAAVLPLRRHGGQGVRRFAGHRSDSTCPCETWPPPLWIPDRTPPRFRLGHSCVPARLWIIQTAWAFRASIRSVVVEPAARPGLAPAHL